MFDRSPVGLKPLALGFRFRCMLGRHIFRHLGKHVKIFHNVEFTYGYNLTIEDGCTIHKNVMLDDRGEIILHEGTSISDFAHVYSHTHNINHQADVHEQGYGAWPSCACHVPRYCSCRSQHRENSMLGAFGLATKPVPPSTVAVGIPARVQGSQRSLSASAE